MVRKPSGVTQYENFCDEKSIKKKYRYPIESALMERFASWMMKKGTLSPISVNQYLAVVKSYSCEISGVGLSKPDSDFLTTIKK